MRTKLQVGAAVLCFAGVFLSSAIAHATCVYASKSYSTNSEICLSPSVLLACHSWGDWEEYRNVEATCRHAYRPPQPPIRHR